MTDDTMASRDLLDGAHLIVGRHTECDAMVYEDPSVSLRHLLVRSTALDDGAPRLSILDLRTDLGFALSDGTRPRAIQTTGPAVLRLGQTTLVALPRGHWPDELPTPVCEREAELRPIVARRVVEAKSISRITMSSGVRHVSEVPLVAGDDWELELESARGRAAVLISNEDLKHGVLVGRADRCVDEGLRRTFDLDVSRVHALLLRDGNETRLFDLASTQGTYSRGRRVRSVVLEPDSAITLAKRNPVQLRWRPASS